jgi:hypothetical protein
MVAWNGRGGTIDVTPLEFSMWGYVIDKVYGPNLPASLTELRARITEAVAAIDADLTQRIWDETA